MSKLQKFASQLEKYLPEKTAVDVARLLLERPVHFKIVKPRKTKLGDFRVRDNAMIITVNGDLNPYSFLITTLHEIAHLRTYIQYKNKVRPHGIEWKKSFQDLLIPFYFKEVFPEEVKNALVSYINNPKASSCSDDKLYRALMKFNTKDEVLVENLQIGDRFQLNNYTFVKGQRARKRFFCTEVHSGKKYMVSGLASVTLIEK